MFISLGTMAQLEVKPGSFKEVTGFINVNMDIYSDDNNVPYAVLKIKTENINDKQRRELLFQGDAQTFIECEYKVGEVWVYLTYKASYLKISHPDLSTTEFWFPFDMEPKKGYELTLVNKAVTSNDEILERLRQLEEASQNQPEPQIIYVERPAEPEPEPVKPKKPNAPRYSFFTINGSMNTYSKPAYGFSIGSMRKAGFFLSFMTNFQFSDIGEEGNLTHFESDKIQAIIDQGYNFEQSYTSLSLIGGVIFKAYGPLNIKAGIGYSNNSLIVKIFDDNNSRTDYWVSDCSAYGFGGLVGVQAHFGKFVISLEGATTCFDTYEARLGIGMGVWGK